jgi:DNA-binding transcriptional ArsR family regulator
MTGEQAWGLRLDLGMRMPGSHVHGVPVVLSEDLLVLVARRLRLIADPVRMRILLSLEQQEMTVQALADEIVGSHQNVSRHLGVLAQAGILSRRREGSHVWYAIADYTALQVIARASASTTGYIEELADLVKAET